MLESYQIEKIKNRNSILSYGSLTVEEQAVFYIYEDLNNIKKNFVDIAFRLNEANNYKYYEKFGYESIIDFSEHLFGFKKSSTYSFINIAQRFCCGMHLSPKYEKFSQSQLTEMCSLPVYLLEHVTSDMTVQDIRDYKKAYNSLTVIDNTYKEPKVLIERYRNSNSIELKDNSIEDNSRRLESNKTDNIEMSNYKLKNYGSYSTFPTPNYIVQWRYGGEIHNYAYMLFTDVVKVLKTFNKNTDYRVYQIDVNHIKELVFQNN